LLRKQQKNFLDTLFWPQPIVVVVTGSMPMPICNRIHKRLANNSKITTFTGVSHFDALMRRLPRT